MTAMDLSVSPRDSAKLHEANKKIDNLLEYILRLSSELKNKDAQLSKYMEVAHEQSQHITSLT